LTIKSSNVEFIRWGIGPYWGEDVTTAATERQILVKITDYVRRSLLDDTDVTAELTETTPLLQLGILNSRNTGRLLAYIHEEFDVSVPPTRITGQHFADLGSITALVAELKAEG
jgi:acyl carrier protein